MKKNQGSMNCSVIQKPVFLKGLIPINQLKEFILEALRSKDEGSVLSSHTYSKPYF